MHTTFKYMRKSFFVILVILLSFPLVSMAKYQNWLKLDGYIILPEKDTVWGKVRVTAPLTQRGLIVWGGYYQFGDHIDVNLLLKQVYFKEEGGKRYRPYNADDILEYSFTHGENRYLFHSLHMRSIFSNKKHEFFLQVVSGEIDVFLRMIPQGYNREGFPTKIVEYYIKDSGDKLVMVQDCENYQTISEFIKGHLGYDISHVELALPGCTFKDIVGVASLYNEHTNR